MQIWRRKILQQSCVFNFALEATMPKKNKRGSRMSPRINPKRKRGITNPPGYRTCCCGSNDCREAMMHYFRHVHRVDDPTHFFPWLYKSVSKLPKPNVKTKNKQRLQDRHDKICRRKIFLKHLGLSEDVPDNSQVAHPVHFPISLYVAEQITWLSLL